MPDRHQDFRASDLCLACGICCHGALHSRAVLEEDEIDPARNQGLDVVIDESGAGFGLPCPKYVGGKCSIYSDRPRACEKYRCHVLQRLEEGRLDASEAMALVSRAKDQIDQLVALDGGMRPFHDLRVEWHGGLSAFCGSADDQDVAASLYVRLTAFMTFLDREFRHRSDSPFIKVEPIDRAGAMG